MQCHTALRSVDGHAHRADETDRMMDPEELGTIAHHDRDAIAGHYAQVEQSVGGAQDVAQHFLPGKFQVAKLEPGLARMLPDALSDELFERSLCTGHRLGSSSAAVRSAPDRSLARGCAARRPGSGRHWFHPRLAMLARRGKASQSDTPC